MSICDRHQRQQVQNKTAQVCGVVVTFRFGQCASSEPADAKRARERPSMPNRLSMPPLGLRPQVNRFNVSVSKESESEHNKRTNPVSSGGCKSPPSWQTVGGALKCKSCVSNCVKHQEGDTRKRSRELLLSLAILSVG